MCEYTPDWYMIFIGYVGKVQQVTDLFTTAIPCITLANNFIFVSTWKQMGVFYYYIVSTIF